MAERARTTQQILKSYQRTKFKCFDTNDFKSSFATFREKPKMDHFERELKISLYKVLLHSVLEDEERSTKIKVNDDENFGKHVIIMQAHSL